MYAELIVNTVLRRNHDTVFQTLLYCREHKTTPERTKAAVSVFNVKQNPSIMEHLAAPAPEVEAAKADRAISSESLTVDPVAPCEDATAKSARSVEPAETVDDPKKFAPPISQEEASHLSVKALRQSGVEFEARVWNRPQEAPYFPLRAFLNSHVFLFSVFRLL